MSRNTAITRTPRATAAKVIITSLSSSEKGKECLSEGKKSSMKEQMKNLARLELNS